MTSDTVTIDCILYTRGEINRIAHSSIAALTAIRHVLDEDISEVLSIQSAMYKVTCEKVSDGILEEESG